MSEFIELISLYNKETVFGVLIVMSACISAVSKLFTVIWTKFMKFYRYKKGIEDKDALIQNTLNNHEENIIRLTAYESETHDDVKAIKAMLEQHIQSDNERTISSFRSTLYRLHMEFTGQGYVTKEGLQMFKDIGKVYESAGGNDIYHNKLEPEVLALPLRYEEGII